MVVAGFVLIWIFSNLFTSTEIESVLGLCDTAIVGHWIDFSAQSYRAKSTQETEETNLSDLASIPCGPLASAQLSLPSSGCPSLLSLHQNNLYPPFDSKSQSFISCSLWEDVVWARPTDGCCTCHVDRSAVDRLHNYCTCAVRHRRHRMIKLWCSEGSMPPDVH